MKILLEIKLELLEARIDVFIKALDHKKAILANANKS